MDIIVINDDGDNNYIYNGINKLNISLKSGYHQFQKKKNILLYWFIWVFIWLTWLGTHTHITHYHYIYISINVQSEYIIFYLL